MVEAKNKFAYVMILAFAVTIIILGFTSACAPYCGDKVCNNGETCSSCAKDCGICQPPQPVCGDNVCNGLETCSSCAKDCGICQPPQPVCGDNVCNGLETCSDCPQDCGACDSICGDQHCTGAETCSTCPDDCGICQPPQPTCGDNVCNGDETCSTCSQDCGTCPVPPQPVCGDNVCNNGETCSTCPCDCGYCAPANKTKFLSSNSFVQFCDVAWVCSGWSECNGGIMTRTCIDKNGCNSEYNKPYERSDCKNTVLSNSQVASGNVNYIWVAIVVILLILLLVVLLRLLN